MIALIFFLSGFAALLYQIVWQRALFAIYGINIESVTIVVTAFMLGLGIGSLTGGAVSRKKVPLLLIFSGAEAAIGCFGLLSLDLFRVVGASTLALPAAATAAIAFLLVLTPTLLMGGTLPLLVAYDVQRSKNVGRSVGALYFVNTLGSAAASFAAALYFLRAVGQSGTIRVAAAMNVAIALLAAVAHLYAKNARKKSASEIETQREMETVREDAGDGEVRA